MSKRRAEDKFQNLSEKGTLNENAKVVTDELFAENGFFDPSDIVQVKYEMLRRVASGESVADAIRAFGFTSYHSFYKALAAFKQRGLAGLVPDRRGPRKKPEAEIAAGTASAGEERGHTDGALAHKFVSEHLEIDFAMRRVRAGNQSIRLTPKEFDLLRYLVSQAGRPIPHRELLEAVWGPDSADQVDYLRVFITYLRKKIEPDPANPQYILTEPWVGYRFLGFDE